MLKEHRAARSKAIKDESERLQAYLKYFEEEDGEYRKELRDHIQEAEREQLVRRAAAVAKRNKAIQQDTRLQIAARRDEFDEATNEMADLILKEARIIRQLCKLRESHAARVEKKNEKGLNGTLRSASASSAGGRRGL